MFKFVSERRIRNKEFKYWKQTELDDIIRRLHDIGITPEDVEMEKVLTDAKDAIVRRGVAPAQSMVIYGYFVAVACNKSKQKVRLPEVKERANITTALIKSILDNYFTEPSGRVTASEISDVLYHSQQQANNPAIALANLLRARLVFETGYDFKVQIRNWVHTGPSVIKIDVMDDEGNPIAKDLNFHIRYDYNQLPFGPDTALELAAMNTFFERRRYQRELRQANELAQKPENQQCEINDEPLGSN